MFGRLLRWYTMYTLLGLLLGNGILPGARFTLRPSLAFSYIGSVITRHSGSQQHQPHFVAWYKEWKYETFARRHFQQRALPIFRRAAITLFVALSSRLGATYCGERVCMFVCLSICMFAYLKNHSPNFTRFSVRVTAVARSSSDVNGIRYALPVLWMTLCFLYSG